MVWVGEPHTVALMRVSYHPLSPLTKIPQSLLSVPRPEGVGTLEALARDSVSEGVLAMEGESGEEAGGTLGISQSLLELTAETSSTT